MWCWRGGEWTRVGGSKPTTQPNDRIVSLPSLFFLSRWWWSRQATWCPRRPPGRASTATRTACWRCSRRGRGKSRGRPKTRSTRPCARLVVGVSVAVGGWCSSGGGWLAVPPSQPLGEDAKLQPTSLVCPRLYAKVAGRVRASERCLGLAKVVLLLVLPKNNKYCTRLDLTCVQG